MKLSTPRWWYRREDRIAPISRALLTPLSWIWAAATARRIARGQPYDPGIPVICVGNLTVGGTGKTPVVREIARRLGAHILTRGYGGRLPGPIRVDLAIHTAADVGDEPLMLAKDLTVWVARDRAAGARAAAEAGAKVIVMDDGHQNPSVLKTLSLLVVDGETRDDEWPFGDGRVFPAGPMREPLREGLARADAVIVLLPADFAVPDPQLIRALEQTSPTATSFSRSSRRMPGPRSQNAEVGWSNSEPIEPNSPPSHLGPGIRRDERRGKLDSAEMNSPRPVLIARLVPTDPPPPGPQVGFAGVGKPWKVERALQAAGCHLADFWPFPDHHPYDEPALARLAARAEQFAAGLITTEKDWARLPPAWRGRVTAWPVRAVFEDEAALDVALVSAR